MEFSIKASAPEKLKTGCLIVAAFSDKGLCPQGESVNAASKGLLARLIKRDLEDKAGSLLPLPLLPGVQAERVLVVSLGKQADYGDKAMRTALATTGRWLAQHSCADAALCATDLLPPQGSLPATLRSAAQLVGDAAYRFDAPRAKKDGSRRGTAKLDFILVARSDNAAKTGLTQGAAIAEGMALARDLGNLPANVCTPSYLAETAQKLGKQFKFKVTVFDKAGIKKLGMGSFLSVTQGATEPPRFIVMEYKKGKPGAAPIVLVGKGITFDTGGISLKPGLGMDEMKYDMCGGAAVMGALLAAVKMQLPLNIVGLIPSSENLPDGDANKPGDIVTSMLGKTIEILNTDAEGRLILCDTLTYAERYNPDVVIDMATLTGACLVALGRIPSGLLGNDDDLCNALIKAGEASCDSVWRLPLWEEYQELLKSPFADLANIGGKDAGTITAACFLSHFAKNFRWAHLDIAGTAWRSGQSKGATGRPVPLLMQYLIDRANAA
jgi:leucyl aminopeptidase